MKFFHLLLLAGMAFGLGSCSAPVPVGNDPVSSRYQTHKINWRNAPGGMTFRFALKQQGGQTLVCGAYYDDGAGEAAVQNSQVRDYTAVDAAGDRLLVGLNYFSRVRDAGALDTATATCAASSKPWRDAYGNTRPSLVLTKRTFRI